MPDFERLDAKLVKPMQLSSWTNLQKVGLIFVLWDPFRKEYRIAYL
jgi:hypothetical protein